MTEQGRKLSITGRSCGCMSPPLTCGCLTTPTWRKLFPHYFSHRWWNRKRIYGTSISSDAQKRYLRYFLYLRKTLNTQLINNLTGSSWAEQFSYQYCHIGPPINN